MFLSKKGKTSKTAAIVAVNVLVGLYLNRQTPRRCRVALEYPVPDGSQYQTTDSVFDRRLRHLRCAKCWLESPVATRSNLTKSLAPH